MRRLLIVALAALLPACGGTGTGGTGEAPAAAGAGSAIRDGLVVAEGTRLPLPAFVTDEPSGGVTWRAVLRLEEDVDLRGVSEDYARQAAALGLVVGPVECVDRDGRGSGSPQIEEGNPGGRPQEGESCQWDAREGDRSLTYRATVSDRDDLDGVLLVARRPTG